MTLPDPIEITPLISNPACPFGYLPCHTCDGTGLGSVLVKVLGKTNKFELFFFTNPFLQLAASFFYMDHLGQARQRYAKHWLKNYPYVLAPGFPMKFWIDYRIFMKMSYTT